MRHRATKLVVELGHNLALAPLTMQEDPKGQPHPLSHLFWHRLGGTGPSAQLLQTSVGTKVQTWWTEAQILGRRVECQEQTTALHTPET